MKKYLFIVLLVGFCFGQKNLNRLWIDMENFNIRISDYELPHISLRYIYEIIEDKQLVDYLYYQDRKRIPYTLDPITESSNTKSLADDLFYRLSQPIIPSQYYDSKNTYKLINPYFGSSYVEIEDVDLNGKTIKNEHTYYLAEKNKLLIDDQFLYYPSNYSRKEIDNIYSHPKWSTYVPLSQNEYFKDLLDHYKINELLHKAGIFYITKKTGDSGSEIDLKSSVGIQMQDIAVFNLANPSNEYEKNYYRISNKKNWNLGELNKWKGSFLVFLKGEREGAELIFYLSGKYKWFFNDNIPKELLENRSDNLDSPGNIIICKILITRVS